LFAVGNTGGNRQAPLLPPIVGDDTPSRNRIQCHVINSRLFNMRRRIAASVGRLTALIRGRLLEQMHEKGNYRAFFFGYLCAWFAAGFAANLRSSR
tara:strand:+ start:1138 stop:1425 length:288 start_codon:yes stop_codon:yes gene_type:complete